MGPDEVQQTLRAIQPDSLLRIEILLVMTLILVGVIAANLTIWIWRHW